MDNNEGRDHYFNINEQESGTPDQMNQSGQMAKVKSQADLVEDQVKDSSILAIDQTNYFGRGNSGLNMGSDYNS